MPPGVLDIFRDGVRYNRHAPIGRAQKSGEQARLDARLVFLAKHRDLYRYAQAVGYLYCRPQQRELDMLRRRVMEHINEARDPGTLRGPVIHPARISIRSMEWSDYVMTPEFHMDATLTGIMFPGTLIRNLRSAHREQVKAVLHAAGL